MPRSNQSAGIYVHGDPVTDLLHPVQGGLIPVHGSTTGPVHGSNNIFTPAAISTLLWLDPTDKAKMFQTGTRASPGTPVANDGDPVGLILDKSGNNNDFGQATAGQRPLFRTGGGRSWLQFDGVDDNLVSLAAVNLSAIAKLGIVAGFTPAVDTFGMLVEHGPNVNTTGGSFYMASGDPANAKLSTAINNGATIGGAGTNAATFGNGVASVESYGSLDITQGTIGAQFPMRVNGAAAAVSAFGTIGAGTVFSSQIMNIGARAGPTLNFNGKFTGLVMSSGGFSAANLPLVESWMGGNMGLSF